MESASVSALLLLVMSDIILLTNYVARSYI